MLASIQALSADQLAPDAVPPTWLWPGVLATGSITLLVGEWKAGKTTLLSVLLARLATGGTLAGRPVRQASVLVISEEAPVLWKERNARFHYPNTIRFLCQPFPGQATHDEWQDLIDVTDNTIQHKGFPDVLVLDPLMMFFPGDGETYTKHLVNLLIPLRRLTNRGCAILMLHHPPKNPGRKFFGRGNAGLHAFVDIDAKFFHDRDSRSDRVRRIEAKSRIFGSGASFRLSLTEDGLDYEAVPEEPVFGGWEEGWLVIRGLLESAGKPLSALEIRKAWFEDYERPCVVTLRRWLWHAHAEGLLTRSGSGRCNDPYRFTLKR